jgi:ATP-binding cassette subfamily B protein
VQRLGLARAFAHAGRVMILDDVATSLDTVTEHHISQLLLAGPLAQRTRLIVARRVSTAAAADFVVWLEGGGVRAVGPHAELWRDPGYREVLSCS